MPFLGNYRGQCGGGVIGHLGASPIEGANPFGPVGASPIADASPVGPIGTYLIFSPKKQWDYV